jgi:N-acetylmuramoyl-L-alanine amidase
MSYTVKSHLLQHDGKTCEFVQTPNGGRPLKPLYLIIHYTAGTTAKSAVNWFKRPEAKASAHLVIDLDGGVTQMMPFNRVCWHAGRSELNGIVGYNNYSIGIEIVNAGLLTKSADGKWRTWYGNVIPDKDVVIATHKHGGNPSGWHIFTAAQIDAVTEIGVALNQTYKFIDVLGHEDVSRGRKIDPGPAFPLPSVRSKILGRGEGQG